MQKWIRLLVIATLMLGGVYVISAQDETGFPYPFVGVLNGQLQIFSGDAPIPVNVPTNRGIISTAWSPDSSKLAVLYYDENYQSRVMVSDPAAGGVFTLETGTLEAGFPISFTPEGEILYVQQTTNQVNPDGTYHINLNTIAPVAGAQPETIGSVVQGVGCGGGSILPADWRYGDESGFSGNYLTLEWTLYGILHSTSCGGSTTSLFDPATGEDTPLPGTNSEDPVSVGRLKVSPDGETVAAVRSAYEEPAIVNSLLLISLATGELTEVATAAQPDQLAWATDGTIFYSTRTPNGNLMETFSAEQKAAIIEAMGFDPGEIMTYNVSVHQLNPATGDDVEIYSSEAYAVGRMEASADGKYLFLTQVSNLDNWLLGLSDGSINLVDDVDGSQQRASVPVSLVQIPLTTEDAPQVIGDWSQIDLQPELV